MGMTSGVYAQEGIENSATPYGDYCTCGNYGICKNELSHSEAASAINAYFEEKGLKAENIRGRGRFIEADIYRDGNLVDRIIFDRKTGRLRSMY